MDKEEEQEKSVEFIIRKMKMLRFLSKNVQKQKIKLKMRLTLKKQKKRKKELETMTT